jgi:hypothetical protein
MKRAVPDPVGLACAMTVTLVAAVLSSVVFGRIPHVQDSIAQLFQARIFAHGRLWMPSPPLHGFFDYAHIISDGRWYSQYPPGHSLLLVPGVWLGLPWLVNPLLGGLSVVGIFLLAREAFGRAAARAAAVLAVLSPFLVLMASEFMAHVSGLFAVTWFLLYALRTWRSGSRRDAGIGGAFLLLAVLVRPYTAFACALPVFAHAGWWYGMARSRAARSPVAVAGEAGDRVVEAPSARFHAARSKVAFPPWRPLLILAAGGAAGAVLYGLYNWGTTGDPLTPGYIRLYGPSHGLGFGKGSWGPPHTLVRGLRHAGANLVTLNHDLFAWPLTSLWPLLVGLLPAGASAVHGAARSARERGGGGRAPGQAITGPAVVGGGEVEAADRPVPIPGVTALLALVPTSLLLLHVFYWFHDVCFGPRYLYESLGPILALSGLGLVRAVELLTRGRRVESKGEQPVSRKRGENAKMRGPGRLRWVPLAALGVLLLAYAGVTGWPRLFRTPPEAVGAPPATPLRMGSYFQHFGREFWGVSPRLGEIVKAQVPGRALVFVRLREIEPDNPQVRHLWFGSAFARLDPDFRRARIVYAKDRGEENARLAAMFPDRPAYLYTGTIEGGTVAPWRPAP